VLGLKEKNGKREKHENIKKKKKWFQKHIFDYVRNLVM
jgi:hypothetical protein